MVFPFKEKGFPRKSLYSCVVVLSMCLLKFIHSYIEFFPTLCPWLEVNLRNTSDKIGQFLSWSCFFAFSIWGLWLHRNKRIFKQLGAGVCNVGGVMNVDLDLDYYFSAGRIKPTKEKIPVHVKWNKPDLNWLKLNTDGSALQNPGLAGSGRLIRHHNGCLVKGFARAIGIATRVEAELWALRDGLQLCAELNVEAIEVELDAKVVMEWVSN